MIYKEFSSLFAETSKPDDSRASADGIDIAEPATAQRGVTADDLGGVVAGAGGAGNAQSAPSNSGVGSPQSQKTGGSSILPEVEGFAEGLLGPIPSIVSDIVSIFGGGGSKAAPVFPKYELPASIDFQATVDSSGGLDASDINQYGDPRDLAAVSAPLAGGTAADTAPAVAPVAGPTAAPAGEESTSRSGHTFHQTFNMQAFDGAGMAAMSDQIAASVRQSLLTSNALSDVITNDLN